MDWYKRFKSKACILKMKAESKEEALDEVAAHLDPDRRVALFDRLRSGGAQVWMTGTEIAPFDAIAGEAAVWEVRGGAVSPR